MDQKLIDDCEVLRFVVDETHSYIFTFPHRVLYRVIQHPHNNRFTVTSRTLYKDGTQSENYSVDNTLYDLLEDEYINWLSQIVRKLSGQKLDDTFIKWMNHEVSENELMDHHSRTSKKDTNNAS